MRTACQHFGAGSCSSGANTTPAANAGQARSGCAAYVSSTGRVTPERPAAPVRAGHPFRSWFRGRASHAAASGEAARPPILLRADTFNNYFQPDVAIAVTEVLERAGFQVLIPEQPLCCGRPLYDYGMLDRARAYLERTLTALQPQIRAGIPMVVLEPSCAAVFRDEPRNLLAHDEDGARLAQQTYLLSEVLSRAELKPKLPRLARRALVHGHCHHKALMGMDAESEVLAQLGVDSTLLSEAGCCGMAGSFGYERGKYEVSIACGEQVLLPEVRRAGWDTLIVADGFSCREQIAQTTPRNALHLAQVIDLAERCGERGPSATPPERYYVEPRQRATRRSMTRAAAGVGLLGALASAGLIWRR